MGEKASEYVLKYKLQHSENLSTFELPMITYCKKIVGQ